MVTLKGFLIMQYYVIAQQGFLFAPNKRISFLEFTYKYIVHGCFRQFHGNEYMNVSLRLPFFGFHLFMVTCFSVLLDKRKYNSCCLLIEKTFMVLCMCAPLLVSCLLVITQQIRWTYRSPWYAFIACKTIPMDGVWIGMERDLACSWLKDLVP